MLECRTKNHAAGEMQSAVTVHKTKADERARQLDVFFQSQYSACEDVVELVRGLRPEADREDERGSSLALRPGSGGWTSARACSYPQEILLQLPRGAEIHEVEVAAPFPLAPRAVDVFLSAGSREDRLAGNPNFQHVCCLELRGVGSKPSRLLKAKQKFFGLCTGQVRLLIHEPVATGSENPYKQ
ncbi:hypothetical protein AK812_SmicGene35918, partial [Symbiodinium microadriaticum]